MKKRTVFELLWLGVSVALIFWALAPEPVRKVTDYKIDKNIVYTGKLEDQRFSGKGTLKFKDGSIYKGDFVAGRFEGQGIYKAPAGWVYKGQFKDGQANGKGTLTTEKAKVFSGKFKDGVFKK